MKLVMTSVFDKKARYYHSPFYWKTVDEALRTHRDLLKQKNTFTDHESDYELYLVGEFDQGVGHITPTLPPKYITNLGNLLDGTSVVDLTDDVK